MNELLSYAESLGIIEPKAVYRNLSVASLVERSLANGEGKLTKTGALLVETGKYTGRSPFDRFVVDTPAVHNDVDWGNVNMPISEEVFDNIYDKLTAYLQRGELYIFDGYAGADPNYRLPVRVINELASQNLFIRQLLVRPTYREFNTFAPEFTVICAPGFKCMPARDGVHSEACILVNFEKKMILIAGSRYAGEIKKAIFSVMNYFMPKRDVLPMHCSANVGKDGDTALFFGLSGTGKTTLSTDPNRALIGDDEHGWSEDGVFNFEGGCYAKTIGLSKESEPEIYNAIRFGALLENVVMDLRTRELDFNDASLTENCRVAYPACHIPNAIEPGIAGHPKTVFFLTADAFGVMPPISKLSRNAAMYHFVSGYTSKLAGTERGITEPVTTFSTLFGAPFMPMEASVYAEMLGERIDKYGVNVYMINTGWCGHKAGDGKRMSLKYTRAMLTAALNGDLDNVEYELDPIFNVMVPTSCPNVPADILSPRKMWAQEAGEEAYEAVAKDLASRFVENFKQYTEMPAHIVEAGPKA